MALVFTCPKCNMTLKAPESAAGRRAKCAKCGTAVQVPNQTQNATAKSAGSAKQNAAAGSPASDSAAAPAAQWYVQTGDGQKYGPVDRQDLDQWVEEGRLDATTRISCDGWPDWKPAREEYPQLAADMGADAELKSGAPFIVRDEHRNESKETNPFASPVTTSDAGQIISPDEGPIDVTALMRRALEQTRPWVLFLAILGFISTGFMVMGGLGLIVVALVGGQPEMIFMGILYLVMAALYVFGFYYLFAFSKNLGDFKRRNDARSLEKAFVAQKSFWKYVGIITLVVIGLYILVIIGVVAIGIIGAAAQV